MNKDHPLFECLDELEDPRTEKHSSRHLLIDILMLTIIAVICGADNWVSIEKFGRSKYEWLKTFLALPNGIPSHDTIGDLFTRLDPNQLQQVFLKWINALFDVSGGEIIAIDGKTLKQSYDTASNRPAIHMINAWACHNELVLGQYKSHTKSNEITAIPELLKLLDLQDNIVTLDAMGCQKQIAEPIKAQGGDYVLTLKGNQGELYDEVRFFLNQERDQALSASSTCDQFEVTEDDHGRIETRRYWITDHVAWLDQLTHWPGLKGLGMVEYESTNKRTGEAQTETRYFLTSLQAKAQAFSQAARFHWGIENKLHWCLDVSFREDACRVRKNHAPENLAVIRQIALNLLKQEKTAKTGIQNKRLMAGWDHAYLAKILKGAENV
jgi:predicted transposase YbfD/YdcC